MVEDLNLYARFEQFVVRLFSARDFAIEKIRQPVGPDLLARRGEQFLAIEVKFYRSTRVSRSLLLSGAKQAVTGASSFQATPCLVLSNILDAETRVFIVQEFGIAIYDYNDLFLLIGNDLALAEELNSLLREAYQFEVGPLPVPVSAPVAATASKPKSMPSGQLKSDAREGARICTRLTEVKVGRPGASLFEQRCFEALQFLFSDDLVSWRLQPKTNSGLHRFDASARIASSHSVWLTLANQFRTRSVVFEFKNYSEAITQAQIYSTEKYLYPAALRGSAIIISRCGASANAQEAARGALRENGKLILLLDRRRICDMLRAKDSGDSPSDLLGDTLDDMLIALDR